MRTRSVHKSAVSMVISRVLGAFRVGPTTRSEVLAMIATRQRS
jgi:GTP cyclohydrolase I